MVPPGRCERQDHIVRDTRRHFGNIAHSVTFLSQAVHNLVIEALVGE